MIAAPYWLVFFGLNPVGRCPGSGLVQVISGVEGAADEGEAKRRGQHEATHLYQPS